jgi:hypothetical protein
MRKGEGLGTARCGWSGRCRIVLVLGSLAIASLGALAQDEPKQQPSAPQGNSQPEAASQPGQSPNDEKKGEEKKTESPNPAQVAAVATRDMGKAALFKARDWESGFLTGIYVGSGQPLLPVTREERRVIYLDQTLATPGAYMKRMFTAGIDQARGTPSQWDDGWGGYAERFASREGQFITANTLAYLGNSALKYDPRYDQCRCSGFWPRTRHAVLRNFVTYNQSERELRPQWGLYGGSFGGGLVSTAWKPHPRNAFAEGGRAMLGQAGYGALLNFFIEFSTDINRKIGAKKRKME